MSGEDKSWRREVEEADEMAGKFLAKMHKKSKPVAMVSKTEYDRVVSDCEKLEAAIREHKETHVEYDYQLHAVFNTNLWSVLENKS